MQRSRERFTKPLEPAASTPLPPGEAESFSRGPGQHEELIERVKNGFRETLLSLDRVEKQRQDLHVIVQVDMSVQREILETLKQVLEIVSKPSTPADSATKEEIVSIIGPRVERLKGVGTQLEEPEFTGGKKKKKK